MCIPFLLLLALASFASVVAADVTDAGAGGFTVRNVAEIAAPPKTVWAKLVDDVDQWWESSHSFSNEARNLYIDARIGGCFCERLPDGGGVRHLDVLWVAPEEALRLEGGLGPLQGLAIRGPLTFTLEPTEEGTRVEVVYTVAGYAPDGLERWANPVDRVLAAQLRRLERYVETGNASAEKPSP